MDQRTPVRERRAVQGGTGAAGSSKAGRSRTPTAEPLIPLSPCLRGALKGAIQGASWEQVSFGAYSQPLLSVATAPSPAPTLIPCSGPPPRPSFPSGAHTSPDFEDFPGIRSLCGRSLASPCLSSAAVGSAEPEGKQPLVAPSLPDAFLAFWLEIRGLFLRKLFPFLDSWKPSWSF